MSRDPRMKVCQRIRPRALPRIARPRLAGMILTASTICPGAISLQAAPLRMPAQQSASLQTVFLQPASLQSVAPQSVAPQPASLQATAPQPASLQTGSDPHGPAARSRPRATAAAVTASPALARLPSAPQQGLLAQGPAAAPTPQTGAAAAAGAGLVTIESDRQQADNGSGVITASGNVRITYPERRLVATARQAQYFSREGRLVLSGDVDVIDADGQRIRAERLVYRLDSGRLVASSAQGQQVYSRLRLQSGSGSPAPTLLP
jgi:lipopolysaccharide export system protein LptA